MNIPASISVGICWDGFEVLLIITNTVTSHSERVTWRACSSNENGFLRAKAWIWNNSIRQLQFVLAWLLKVILGYVFHWKDLPVICFQMYSWRISYIIQWHRIIFYLPFPTHLQLSPDIPWHGSRPALTSFPVPPLLPLPLSPLFYQAVWNSSKDGKAPLRALLWGAIGSWLLLWGGILLFWGVATGKFHRLQWLAPHSCTYGNY